MCNRDFKNISNFRKRMLFYMPTKSKYNKSKVETIQWLLKNVHKIILLDFKYHKQFRKNKQILNRLFNRSISIKLVSHKIGI